MISTRRSRLLAIATVAAALATLAGGGWAIAATGKTIHGCANRKSGALRLAAKCKRTERAVSWSQTGPAGPRGAQGAQGPAGPLSSAGGALSGSYPDPDLRISGGDDNGGTACQDGEAVTGISASGVLSCGTGVLDRTLNGKIGVGDPTIPASATGGSDTAVGDSALGALTGAGDDTALGWSALGFDTTGGFNTGLGTQALYDETSGDQDTAVGEEAGRALTTGNDDTLLGYLAGLHYTSTESSDIVIGADVDGTKGESNVIRIGGADGTGTGEQDALYIPAAGATVTDGTALELDASTGQIGVATSSDHFKTDIRALGPSVQRLLMSLEPVSFHYKARYIKGQPDPLEYGLIAQQVAKVDPNLVVYGADHQPYSVSYQELPALLLAQVQSQQRQLQSQRRQLQSQRRQIQRLQADTDRIGKLQRELADLSRKVARR